MNKYYLLCGLLLLSAASLFSQNVDSLFRLYTGANRGKRIELANEIAKTVYDQQCTDTLFQTTQETPPLLLEAIVNELMANHAMYAKADYALSNHYTRIAAASYEQLGDTLSADIMYGNIAGNYLRMGDYPQAIELLMKCYELEEKTNDQVGLSVTLNSLGIAYSRWGDHQTAIEYFQRALEVEAPLNRPMQYATRLASLAKEYQLLQHYDKALSYIREALSFDEKMERREKEERIAVHQAVMGDIYTAMDSLSQANRCYSHAIQTFSKSKHNNRLAEIYFSMGQLYIKENKRDNAIDMLEQCVEICEKYNMKQLLRNAYHLLYQVNRDIHPITNSLLYLEKYKSLDDSLFQETTRKQMSEFHIKYETQQKELEIVHQQAVIDKHRTRQYLYVTGLIIVALLLILFIYIANLRNKRNRALAETNATKDKFFTIISHDLKNPAIAQRDALQLLISHADKWDSNSLMPYYEELLKSADGQVELLYNLLNWAQVQTGRMPYHPTPFDLSSELRSDMALIKKQAEQKEITLIIDMPETAIITGDRNMLITVIRNLLNNAVKFTQKGGTVTLEMKKDAHNKQTLSVSDNGRGMSRKQLDALFLIDRQHSIPGTAGEPGSGLGLIVCRELIERHGSTLHIESEEGKGSRFFFTIG